MILLLGGTSDTAEIAARLSEYGCAVLVSTATDVPLEIPEHPGIKRRAGPLNAEELAELLVQHDITAIVDATHPYAEQVKHLANETAKRRGIPYLPFIRPPAISSDESDILFVDDHTNAASAAFSLHKPVLLTTGANHLAEYVACSKQSGISLFARILPRPESIESCLQAGILKECVIPQRGPFSVEENRDHIRMAGAGVLVTKDGGIASGVLNKIDATRVEDCRLILIRRPALPADPYYQRIGPLIEAVVDAVLR